MGKPIQNIATFNGMFWLKALVTTEVEMMNITIYAVLAALALLATVVEFGNQNLNNALL